MKATFPAQAILAVLLMAAPAFAQDAPKVVRVYTDADLNKKITKPALAITPEVWASFVAHQFVYVPKARPDYYGGARVTLSNWTMPTAAALERPTYPLSTPFYMSTYTGPSWYGPSRSRTPVVTPHVPDAIAITSQSQIRGR